MRRDYAPPGESVPWRARLAAMRGPVAIFRAVHRHDRRHLRRRVQPDRGCCGRRFRRHRYRCARPAAVADLFKSIESTVVTCGVLFLIVFGANLFSFFMVQTQLPHLLADGARALHLPGVGVMALMIVAYIIFGCFLEGIGMVLITVPVFLPMVMQFGYDPVWFGVIVVIVVEVGLIHPPVGHEPVRHPGQGAGHQDHQHLSRHRAVPDRTAGADHPAILVPQIALWLPKALYGN